MSYGRGRFRVRIVGVNPGALRTTWQAPREESGDTGLASFLIGKIGIDARGV